MSFFKLVNTTLCCQYTTRLHNMLPTRVRWKHTRFAGYMLRLNACCIGVTFALYPSPLQTWVV
jgi:hypothetical protein